MIISTLCNDIFKESIQDYHRFNDLNHLLPNPYPLTILEGLLYSKNQIDTFQWHMEDEIRDPEIDPQLALIWKRKIDHFNQQRTDIVESIDDFFLEKFKHIQALPHAKINSESPAWAIDRLSILALKIFHMEEQSIRKNASAIQKQRCLNKLDILLEQQRDLSQSIDELLADIKKGHKVMKVYRQMKMYNDPTLNPIFYQFKPN